MKIKTIRFYKFIGDSLENYKLIHRIRSISINNKFIKIKYTKKLFEEDLFILDLKHYPDYSIEYTGFNELNIYLK